MTEEEKQQLLVAIGRTTVGVAKAHYFVRPSVGLLGGVGVALLASRESDISVLLSWCDRLAYTFDLSAAPDVKDAYVAHSGRLAELLEQQRAVQGYWYADDIVPGQVGGPDGPLVVPPLPTAPELNALADELNHVSLEFHYAAQAVARANPLPM